MPCGVPQVELEPSGATGFIKIIACAIEMSTRFSHDVAVSPTIRESCGIAHQSPDGCLAPIPGGKKEGIADVGKLENDHQ